jgi:hypothetical protein
MAGNSPGLTEELREIMKWPVLRLHQSAVPHVSFVKGNELYNEELGNLYSLTCY